MRDFYGDRDEERYGERDEDERYGARGYDNERGYGRGDDYGNPYGSASRRAFGGFDTSGRAYGSAGRERDYDDYGHEGIRDYGRDFGRDYGRDYSRDYDARGYGRGYGARGSDRERNYGEGGPERDFIDRGYERSYERAAARDDERYGRETDYGRTRSRFFGRGGEEYERGDREDYRRRLDARSRGYARGRDRRRDDDRDDDRDERFYRARSRRGEGRGWWDRAADEVLSWFGDEDAERRRHHDEMRAGRHRGRGPRSYRRSDERIREDINDRLTDDYWLDASDIEVEVVGGEVTLTGMVDSRRAKRHAEDIAEAVSGVSHVQNNLRVRRWQAAPSGLDAPAGTFGTSGVTPPVTSTGAPAASGGLTTDPMAGTTRETDATDLTDTTDKTRLSGTATRAAGNNT